MAVLLSFSSLGRFHSSKKSEEGPASAGSIVMKCLFGRRKRRKEIEEEEDEWNGAGRAVCV